MPPPYHHYPLLPTTPVQASALRAILLDILFLLTTLILLGSLLNAVLVRRQDRERRRAWEEYWGDDENRPDLYGPNGRPRTSRRNRVLEEWLNREEDEEDWVAEETYGERERRIWGSRIFGNPWLRSEASRMLDAEDGDETLPRYDGTKPPGYDEITKEDQSGNLATNGGGAGPS